MYGAYRRYHLAQCSNCIKRPLRQAKILGNIIKANVYFVFYIGFGSHRTHGPT